MLSVYPPYTLAELTDGLEVTIKGDACCLITGISTIQEAQPGHITFLTNSHYRKYLSVTQASAVILGYDDANICTTNAVISQNPYFTYAKIASFFDRGSFKLPGIHPSTVIEEGCDIHPSVSIGPFCTIGRQVKIAQNTVIGPGCIIGEFSMLDEAVHIDAKVTVYRHVQVGKRTHINSGAVIGSDGFGFANHQGVWHKVPQLGGVVIGQDVDIGANTTIDCGALAATVIEDGVKLDNLIQIAHNVKIGAHTIIAGCVAIAGSTVIGKHCIIGGGSRFAGHITVCDNAIITGMTAVTKSIREPGMYSSGIVGAVPNLEFRKNNARFNRLEQLMQRVKRLELALKELTERKVT
jgi:UDP-3-O-[3-hydroxymyristoyl] glucosamine N-acyltransferase